MRVVTVEALTFTPSGANDPALAAVTLDVRAGEVLLVEGASGSGKTTLLRAIAGLVPHFHGGEFHGHVSVLGNDTRHTPPAVLAHDVALVFQDPETQAVRSRVASDVAFGPENLGVPAGQIEQRVSRALGMAEAAHLADRDIGTLSGGERQRVAIASALACEPKVLLFDEPTSQLDDAAVRGLDVIIRSCARRGTAVVIAEHHAHRLGDVADRVIHLEHGRLVGCPDLDEYPAPGVVSDGPVLLAARSVTASWGGRPVLRDCSIELRAGTVTALHGDNGAGKSTLLRALIGLHSVDGGAVLLDGRDITTEPTEARVPAIGLLPQDGGRRLLRERVRDEVRAGATSRGRLESDRVVANVMTDLDIERLADRHPLDLSVGERERVALAAVLAAEPRVLLLDEPSRGMGPEHRTALARVIHEHARRGTAVLVASHDPWFADQVADRHVTLRDGVLVADVEQVPT